MGRKQVNGERKEKVKKKMVGMIYFSREKFCHSLWSFPFYIPKQTLFTVARVLSVCKPATIRSQGQAFIVTYQYLSPFVLLVFHFFFYARLKSRSSLGLCFGVSSQFSGFFSDAEELGCMNNLTLFPNVKVPIYIMNGICGWFRFLTNRKLIQLIPCRDFISACITASTRKYNFELIGIFKTGLDILFKGKEYTRSKYLRN